MISRIDRGDAAGDVACEIADEACGHCPDIFDSDKPALRRSRASRLYQLVEMIDIRQLVENQRS